MLAQIGESKRRGSRTHPRTGVVISGCLNQFDREEIRAAHAAGIPVKQLTEEYLRTKATIRRILKRSD